MASWSGRGLAACNFFHKRVKFPSVAQTPSSGSPGSYAGFGIQFVVAILLFAYAGSWIDRYAGSRPLFMIVGVFVGAGGTFYSMYRRVKRDAAPAVKVAERTRNGESRDEREER